MRSGRIIVYALKRSLRVGSSELERVYQVMGLYLFSALVYGFLCTFQCQKMREVWYPALRRTIEFITG